MSLWVCLLLPENPNLQAGNIQGEGRGGASRFSLSLSSILFCAFRFSFSFCSRQWYKIKCPNCSVRQCRTRQTDCASASKHTISLISTHLFQSLFFRQLFCFVHRNFFFALFELQPLLTGKVFRCFPPSSENLLLLLFSVITFEWLH